MPDGWVIIAVGNPGIRAKCAFLDAATTAQSNLKPSALLEALHALEVLQ
jgi:hypothetical protein